MDQQCDENTESARVSVLLRFLVVFVCLFVLFIFNSRYNNTITFYRFPFLREGGKGMVHPDPGQTMGLCSMLSRTWTIMWMKCWSVNLFIYKLLVDELYCQLTIITLDELLANELYCQRTMLSMNVWSVTCIFNEIYCHWTIGQWTTAQWTALSMSCVLKQNEA